MDYAKWANKEIDRIAEPRERTATVVALGERLGMSKGTIYSYLRGEYEFSTEQVDKMAEFFGMESPAKAKRNHKNNNDEERSNVVQLRASAPVDDDWISYDVLGVVDAGAWREADLISQVEPRRVQGERSASYPNARPMAWEARGDSMNEKGIFNGTILFGVDFQAAGGVLTNDMIVVVERRRGGTIERSVKAVAVFQDRIEFQPRSTDPRHKPFVYKNGHSDDDVTEVKVLSVIHGWYSKP